MQIMASIGCLPALVYLGIMGLGYLSLAMMLYGVIAPPTAEGFWAFPLLFFFFMVAEMLQERTWHGRLATIVFAVALLLGVYGRVVRDWRFFYCMIPAVVAILHHLDMVRAAAVWRQPPAITREEQLRNHVRASLCPGCCTGHAPTRCQCGGLIHTDLDAERRLVQVCDRCLEPHVIPEAAPAIAPSLANSRAADSTMKLSA